MLAGGRWSRILAVLNTFCGALSSGLYRPLPAGSTTAFNNSPQSAGNCPKTLCNAGVPAGKKKLQRRALPARRRRYKAQMHPFSEFWDSLADVRTRAYGLTGTAEDREVSRFKRCKSVRISAALLYRRVLSFSNALYMTRSRSAGKF